MGNQNDQTKNVLYIAMGILLLVTTILIFASFFFFFGINIGPNDYATKKIAPRTNSTVPIKQENPKPKKSSTEVGAIKVDGMAVFANKQTAIGQELDVKSTFDFNPEGYTFKIKSIDENNIISLEYDKALLGSPCSSDSGKGLLEIPRSVETCLTSTTCDAGDVVCFENLEVENGIKLRHVIERYDGEAGL